MEIKHTSNYRKFNYLSFNRNTDSTHISRLSKSVKKHGNLRVIVTIKTDIITGSNQLFIADGQHLFEALRGLNRPIYYIEHNVSSMSEIIQLIADLNNNSKSWTFFDHVRAWSMAKEQYLYLSKLMIRFKFQPVVMIAAFNTTISHIKKGLFNPSSQQKKKAEKHLKNLNDIKNVLNLNAKISKGYINFVNSLTSYRHNKMITNLSACLSSISNQFEGLHDEYLAFDIWNQVYSCE